MGAVATGRRTGITLSFAGESPDALGARYPVGAPITLKYLGDGRVSLSGCDGHGRRQAT